MAKLLGRLFSFLIHSLLVYKLIMALYICYEE